MKEILKKFFFTKLLGFGLCVWLLGLSGVKGYAHTSLESNPFFLELPVLDLPYQIDAAETTGNFFLGYGNPHMTQSLALSNNLYLLGHWGLKELIQPNRSTLRFLIGYAAIFAFDFFSLYVPLGTSWLHEEYHRAVLTRRRIQSANEVNTFPFGKDVVAVYNLKDEDLIRLSDEYNTDFRRLMSAGIEGQYHQIQILQTYNFFFNQQLPHGLLYWLTTINSIAYVAESSTSAFDSVVDKMNAKENDIRARDFTGPDFTAWVHALFYPDEPYTNRGTHPSGIGINRYIKPSQLTSEEGEYLKKQGQLQWLNLLSPHLFGFSRIKLGSSDRGPVYGNFAVRHILTPFGSDISVDLFYKDPGRNLLVTVHTYQNQSHAFWGVEGWLWDFPLIHNPFRLTLRGALWMQPKELSFYASTGKWGGLLGLRVWSRQGLIAPYAEIEGKTRGWVMGNVFLEENVSFRMGVYILPL